MQVIDEKLVEMPPAAGPRMLLRRGPQERLARTAAPAGGHADEARVERMRIDATHEQSPERNIDLPLAFRALLMDMVAVDRIDWHTQPVAV
jgi:hypothetical protein